MKSSRARRLMVIAAAALILTNVVSIRAHERFRFVGTIVKMDTAKKLLTIKTGRKDHPPQLEIDITPKTKIERDGKKVPVAELKAGRYVVVDALGDDMLGTEALQIRIVPAPKS